MNSKSKHPEINAQDSEISTKNRPEVSEYHQDKKTKPERPDRIIEISDINGQPKSFHIRKLNHSFYVTNGQSRYFLDIPERIEVDKETFASVMYVATGERFYRRKA